MGSGIFLMGLLDLIRKCHVTNCIRRLASVYPIQFSCDFSQFVVCSLYTATFVRHMYIHNVADANCITFERPFRHVKVSSCGRDL